MALGPLALWPLPCPSSLAGLTIPGENRAHRVPWVPRACAELESRLHPQEPVGGAGCADTCLRLIESGKSSLPFTNAAAWKTPSSDGMCMNGDPVQASAHVCEKPKAPGRAGDGRRAWGMASATDSPPAPAQPRAEGHPPSVGARAHVPCGQKDHTVCVRGTRVLRPDPSTGRAPDWGDPQCPSEAFVSLITVRPPEGSP